MPAPVIKLSGVRREYQTGEEVVAALDHVDLEIGPGELVAIVGASGSGKSTLMNILGCLDRPTSGVYEVFGQDTSHMDADQLAALRRERFGFIFQRYHLIPNLSALENVEIPAVYAGRPRREREARAGVLLDRLGLGDRVRHKPSQLSGGQQQRVSIARALMNGGDLILADEPTGALDSHSGAEMMRLIQSLNAEGHTIIIVTHDMEVAENTRRIIEIKDGRIIADRRTAPEPDRVGQTAAPAHAPERRNLGAQVARLAEAAHMAVVSLNAHRLRAFLTMLGIIIGIASVVSVVALGEGSRKQILKTISSIGTNTVDVFPGKDFGDEKASSIHTLSPADTDALRAQPYVDSVTATTQASVVMRYDSTSVNGEVNGVGEQYFRVKDVEIAQGRAFDAGDVAQMNQVAVIDDNTRKKLFPLNPYPIGQVILLGSTPFRVIGVAAHKDSTFGRDENLNIWAPYSTVLGRMLGVSYLKGITVRVRDETPIDAASTAVVSLLSQRHGAKDFFFLSSETVRQTINATTRTMTLLIGSIALISLLVGGIGVMNIMLVSVTERTREIGVRAAVGARRSDIMSQFLIEAVLVCLTGGAVGVALALILSVVIPKLSGGSFTMELSPVSVGFAVIFSTIIGVAFGFTPALNASKLDPVEALSRE